MYFTYFSMTKFQKHVGSSNKPRQSVKSPDVTTPYYLHAYNYANIIL